MNFDIIVLYYLFFFAYGLVYSYKSGKPATFITLSFLFELPVTGRMIGIW